MAWHDDQLLVCSTTQLCKDCRLDKLGNIQTGKQAWKMRRACQSCRGTGYSLSEALRGLWRDRPGYLVCGGPSLAQLPLERLRERGIVSLAINNAGAYAPTKAHTFGDPQTKFHSDMYLDPAVISFVPFGKLYKEIQIKHGGQFYPTSIKPVECPNVWGFSRTSTYDRNNFLTNESAHWGAKLQPLETITGRFSKLCTMLLGFRLLHYLGVNRIYLLGVDFDIPSRDSGKPGYAWGDNASSGNKVWDDKINPMMHELKPVMLEGGIDIFNCNPNSKCDAFDYVSFEDSIKDCKGPLEDEPLDCNDWYDKKKHESDHKLHPTPLGIQDIVALRNR